MRNWWQILAISMLLMASCAKKKSEVAQAPNPSCLEYGTCNFNYAAQPGWQPYAAQNGAYVGQNTGYANGYCGCNSGYLPAYNSQFGLGCVQSNQLFPTTTYPAASSVVSSPSYVSPTFPAVNVPSNNIYPNTISTQPNSSLNTAIGFPANYQGGITAGFAGGFQTYAWNPNSWDWHNQSPTQYNPYPDANGCVQSVLRACDSREQNACGANGFCRVTGGGSYLGTCLYN